MVTQLNPPLTPRSGVTLHVLLICRISTVHQDLRSLADQEALLRRFVADHHAGPADFHVIASQGSGEYLETRELLDAVAKVESRRIDLVIAEDLGRICRRNYAINFCEIAEDHDTRVITIHDSIDTGRNDWRLHATFSAMKNEAYNKETAQRIRRTLRNRFQEGGVVQTTVYGYIKPPGCSSDSELRKDPAAEPIFDEIFRRLEDGANFCEVADWLNGREIPTGPYCRTGRWDGPMVARLVQNPILKGVRVRNKKKSRRVNKTGKHRSVDAPPEELLERDCPHLAFIDPARFDRVNALLAARNAKYRRGKEGGDCRKDVPKKRTRWPGQHMDCGLCGGLYRYGGHGMADHLLCAGAHGYRCWNAVTADGPLAAEKLKAAILGAIAEMEGCDDVIREQVDAEVARIRTEQGGRRGELQRRRGTLEHQISNIRTAIREGGWSRALTDDLKLLEAEMDAIAGELAGLDRVPERIIRVPPLAEIRGLARDAMTTLPPDSEEFGRIIRRLIPRIEVFPHRLCDGGRAVLRARFALDLVNLIPEASGLALDSQILRRHLTVDLFDVPQRVAYRGRVVAMAAEGLTQREIGLRLGITQPAVQAAIALAKEMDRLGLADPYVEMTGPPDGDTRLRRHQHPRYKFRPKGDADAPRPT
jgi:DNA invertase Pin-like site-specific DNA recombinase